MTVTTTDSVEGVATQPEGRPAWITPTVTRMRAGEAEDGIDPNIADGLLTYS
jgi:hypothetical protein